MVDSAQKSVDWLTSVVEAENWFNLSTLEKPEKTKTNAPVCGQRREKT
jgi:hypothetical protein